MNDRSPTRRTVLVGLGSAIAAPALLRFQLGALHAQEFGLIGDGQSNALPALRAMLKAAEAKGKGTIQLPAGRFLLAPEPKASAIILPANVRLEGAGMSQTILFMADGAFGHVISAPYGNVQIADLAVDGNWAHRTGAIGHNIRLQADDSLVERVRSLNAVSYGIAIGQRRYARNVVIRDSEVVDSGADGIDVKNDLGRTEGILIENVSVHGFGRPDPGITPEQFGTKADKRGDKAGVDLRGKCEVRGLTVTQVRGDRDGLRFRNGEVGDGHGAGAHGSTASNVTVRGFNSERESVAISVMARGVQLTDIDISDTAVGIFLGAENFRVIRGKAGNFARGAIVARRTRRTKPDRIEIDSMRFPPKTRLAIGEGVEAAHFRRCEFADCREQIEAMLKSNRAVSFEDCKFRPSCT